jgi:hypothetical protein
MYYVHFMPLFKTPWFFSTYLSLSACWFRLSISSPVAKQWFSGQNQVSSVRNEISLDRYGFFMVINGWDVVRNDFLWSDMIFSRPLLAWV